MTALTFLPLGLCLQAVALLEKRLDAAPLADMRFGSWMFVLVWFSAPALGILPHRLVTDPMQLAALRRITLLLDQHLGLGLWFYLSDLHIYTAGSLVPMPPLWPGSAHPPGSAC